MNTTPNPGAPVLIFDRETRQAREAVELRGTGAHVHGHPVSAVEADLVRLMAVRGPLANVGHPIDVPDIATAVTGLCADMYDVSDDPEENLSPGQLYYTFVTVFDGAGVERVSIQAERTPHGHVVYRPTLIPAEHGGGAA
jgi:hypothetical protein